MIEGKKEPEETLQHLQPKPQFEFGPASESPAAGTLFGDYELIEEIARGGMGVVYKARQVKLNRIVALKMILSGQFAGEADVRRFHTEAEAAAHLDHPGIVPIYEVGKADVQHYFSMAYVEGSSLAEHVADGPLAPAEAAELMKRIADAICYAHQQGVIHRDLKPANVLLDADKQPRVTDFGLAKRIAGQSELTAAGQAIGTPGYMPPEQAAGDLEKIDPRSDVYSLGAILYCLLTGRPPFQSANVMDTLLQVRQQEPVSPRQLNPQTPVDLETITLKCLEKEPSRRYGSARELAEDLGRYLAHEPIEARPVSSLERAWKWARRKPWIAGLSAAVLILLATVAAGASVGLVLVNSAWESEQQQKEAAQELAEDNRRQLVRLRVAKADSLITSGDPSGALPWLTSALSLEMGQLDKDNEESQRVHRIRLAAVLRACPRFVHLWRHQSRVLHMSLSPDGKRLVTTSQDAAVFLCNITTGERIGLLHHQGSVNSADFSPDGRELITAGGAYGEHGEIHRWDAVTGKELTAPIQLDDAVAYCRWLADGEHFLTVQIKFQLAARSAATILKKWSIQKKTPLSTVRLSARDFEIGNLTDFARRFDSAGQRVLKTTGNKVWILDFNTGQTVGKPLEHQRQVYFSAFAAGGSAIVSAAGDVVRVWNAASGDPLSPPVHHAAFGNVIAAALWANKTRLTIACWGGDVATFDLPAGKVRGVMSGAGQAGWKAVFSPDRRSVIALRPDGAARVWNLHSGRSRLDIRKARSPLLRHQGFVASALTTPDNRWLITAATDGAVRVWDLASMNGPDQVLPTSQELIWARFQQGKNAVTTVNRLGAVGWDLEQGARPGARISLENRFDRTDTLSEDGTLWAIGDRNSQARVWSLNIGEEIVKPIRHPRGKPVILAVRISADNRYVATLATDDQSIFAPLWARGFIWRLPSGEQVAGPLKLGELISPIISINLSPQGRYAVLGGIRVGAAGMKGEARVFDVSAGRFIGPPLRHAADHAVWDATFSPDGRRLATNSSEQDGVAGELRLWEFPSLKNIGAPISFPTEIKRVVFDSSGERFLVASGAFAQVYSASTGPLDIWPWSPPLEHHAQIRSATLSADGKRAAIACVDGTVRVWDCQAGEALTPPIPHPMGVRDVGFNRRGDKLVTACLDGSARIWNLSPRDYTQEQLEQWSGVLSTQYVTRSGDLRSVDQGEYDQQWRSLRESAARQLATPIDQVVMWRRSELLICEQTEQWQAAALHASRLIELEPKKTSHLLRRAAVLLELGDYRQAAQDYVKVTTLEPNNHGFWYRSVPLLLRAGDREGFQRQSRKMLDRFQDSSDLLVLERSAKACLMEPRTFRENESTVRWARRVVKEGKQHRAYIYFRLVNAIADYRTGKFKRAAGELEKLAQEFSNRWTFATLANYFLAMTLRQQGNEEAAREAFAQGEARYGQRPKGFRSGNWLDWLLCDIAQREAGEMLGAL